MAENMDVRLTLTAEDNASPQMQKLLNQAKALERDIKKSFGRRASTDPFVKNSALIYDHLERTGGAVRQLTKKNMDWAKGIFQAKNGAKLVRQELRRTVSEIQKLEKEFYKLNKSGKAQHSLIKNKRVALRRLLGQHSALAHLVNKDYERRLKLEDRLENKMKDIASHRDRLEKRRQDESERSWREEMRHNRRLLAANVRRIATESRARQAEEKRRIKAIADEEKAQERMWRRMDGRRRGMMGGGLARLDGGGGGFFNSPFFMGTMAAGAVGYGMASLIGREAKTHDQEINLRILSKDKDTRERMSPKEVREWRTQWAMPAAIEYGSTAADMMAGATEAIKVGLIPEAAKDFAVLTRQYSQASGQSIDEVSNIFGIIQSFFKELPDKERVDNVRKVANSMIELADFTKATPEEMSSFMRRGAGASSRLGMDQDIGLAVGAASISLGNEAAKSGRMFDYIAGRLIEFKHLQRTSGDLGDRVRKFLGITGYGSAENMEMQRKKDPNAFFLNLVEKLGEVPEFMRDEILYTLTGQEWLGEFGRIVDNPDMLRDTMERAMEARKYDSLSERWEIEKEKLSFTLMQIGAGIDNVLGELGMVLNPMVVEAKDFFINWSAQLRSAGIGEAFHAVLQGLVNGFMGAEEGRSFSIGMLLQHTLGAINSFDVKAFGEFAYGFADGLKLVWNTVGGFLKTIAGVFGLDDNARDLGKFTAAIIGFSIALHMLRPVMSVFGLFKDVVLGIAGLGFIAKNIFKGAGLLGALIGVGSLPVIVAGLSIAALAVAITNWSDIKDWIKGWFNPGKPDMTPDQFRQGYIERETKKRERSSSDWFGIKPWLEQFDGSSTKELKELNGNVDKMSYYLEDMGVKLFQASYSLSDPMDLVPNLGGSAGGYGGGGGFTDYSASSFIGPNPSSPAGGARAASGLQLGNGLLDAIAEAEGTAGKGDYETVLGYGKYGTPSKPITQMTLAEAFAFGRQIKARHGSSSAIGRYQIVGNTMKDAARGLGMDWHNTKFDATTQDAMAKWIAQNQGLGAWEGFKKNPQALARARSAMNGGAANDNARSLLEFNGNLAPVSYANHGATRNKPIDPDLFYEIQKGVAAVYGPGYRAEIYSGGQDALGRGRRRTGSTRHDDHGHGGGAADLYVYGPDGRRVRGKELAKLGQHWSANRLGGVGLEMRGGGIHLDKHKNRAPHWNYLQHGGTYSREQAEIMRQGLAGIPPKYQGMSAPTPQAMTSGVPATSQPTPTPMARPAGLGSTASAAPSINININGANQDPEQLAQLVQRRISESMAWRTHDTEYDVA